MTPSKPDEFEQSGEGVRELHRRLKAATTPEECLAIAVEAERRHAQPELEPCVETAYSLLVSLARRSSILLAAREREQTKG